MRPNHTFHRQSTQVKPHKSQISQVKIINSSQYLQLCNNNQRKPEDFVYDSLFNYQKKIKILKGCLVLTQAKIKLFNKQKTFNKINLFASTIPIPTEPFTEEEKSFIKPNFLYQKAELCQQLSYLLEEKQQNQQRAQEQFLKSITQQYQSDNLKQFLAVINIERLLNRKIRKVQDKTFLQIKNTVFPQKPSPSVIKNILTSSFMMLSIKMKQTKELVFRAILKQFGLNSIADQIDANMKLKGRALMALKEYPRLNLKRGFWRWYLSSTENGDRLFQNAADKLVLYTNVNKTTFFYRLFNQVRVREIKVDPKVKRMTIMFYLYTKIYYQRPMREFFEKTKIISEKNGPARQISSNLVDCAHLRQKNLIQKWQLSIKKFRENQSQESNTLNKLAFKIIQSAQQKEKLILKLWKNSSKKYLEISQQKKQLLRKILMTKIGKVSQALQIWKLLPMKNKKNMETIRKAQMFQKGLENFVQKTLKRTLDSFKYEFQESKAIKKRAVIQLIQIAQGRQQKFYNRWKIFSQKNKLLNECKQMNTLFRTLYFSIKLTADFAFLENNNSLRKEKALLALFKNLTENISNTFRRWREVNKAEKINKNISQMQKEMLIKILTSLLSNNKTQKIRELINKFRFNKKVTEIQRNFLKRLLIRKANLVLIAFRKFQSLPLRINREYNKKAQLFERGLVNFAQKTLKKALESFKNEFEEGQAIKKRAVIQLIEKTQNSQNKFYNKWLRFLQSSKSLSRCQLLLKTFDNFSLVMNKNFSFIFSNSSFSLHDISTVHKYFTRLCNKTNLTILSFLKTLKMNTSQRKRRTNQWFDRAAFIFATQTRINMQKSLWRLKTNSSTEKIIKNAQVLVKFKKLFNNIRKYYELTIFRAFLMINKNGKIEKQSNENGRSSNTNYAKGKQVLNGQSILQSTNYEQQSSEEYSLTCRKMSLVFCQNIFNCQLSRHLKRWKYNAEPRLQLQQIKAGLKIQNPDALICLNSSQAVKTVTEKIIKSKSKVLGYGFRKILHYGILISNSKALSQSLSEKVELINQQKNLMKQIEIYKKDKESLMKQLQLKQSSLIQTNKAVVKLRLRINFIIGQKLALLIQRIILQNSQKCLDYGFDGIIERANETVEMENKNCGQEEEQQQQ